MSNNSGLGRGLNSLFKESSGEANIDLQTNEIDIKLIEPNPGQPRKHFDDEKLKELADSIKNVGVLQPILVKDKGSKYQIIAGERRYQAAKLAGLKKIPAQKTNADNFEVLQIALIENLQRSDLNPIEEAEGYKALIDQQNLTQAELAKSVSKSRSAIANALRLLDLPDKIQEMLFENKITSGHARAILSIPMDDQRIKLADKVIEDKLSVRETERLAPLYSGKKSDKISREKTPRSFKMAAKVLKEKLNTNVRVKKTKNKNKIEIDFKDEDDLARILEMFE